MLEKLFAKTKNTKPGYKNRKRLLLVFFVIALLFAALTLRLGWHMIIKGDEYAQRAAKQQTSDSVVTAVRGDILDSAGGQMAISATTHTIWVRPSSVKGNGKTSDEVELNARLEAQKLSEMLDMDAETVYETITSDKTLVKLAKFVDQETTDAVRAEKFTGLEIVQDVRRYYPLGAFSCQLLGLTNDDGNGLTGLELYYENYLSGINGRWITSKDNKKNSLVYGDSKYYGATDGYTIVTTIDPNIQYIVEEKVAKYLEEKHADRVACIVMDPNTGYVLAMAQSDEFDPNDPRAPMPGDEEAFAAMTDEEKVAYWNRRWRSFCLSDVYEPGSTFKLITTSIALDAGVTNKNDGFRCGGALQVMDKYIKCWVYPRGHGSESLMEAVSNSCNVAMMNLASRMGRDIFYNGLNAFGILNKTGIDFPGEGSNIVYAKNAAGPVELATMSFGQGISVTPISLITSVSAIANGGYLLQPRLVKEIRDADGKVVESYGRTVKNVVLSKETAQDMLDIMEFVVNNGGGGKSQIPGYRIGGKTGTADKPKSGTYEGGGVYASYIGVAPVDDPKVVVLVVVDNPRSKDIHGSTVAAPCAREVMEETLKYLNIEPKYTEEELKKMRSKYTKVPDLTDQGFENIGGILGAKSLEYELSPALPDGSNIEIVVTDQYPKPGTEVPKGSLVTVYYEIVSGGEEILEVN